MTPNPPLAIGGGCRRLRGSETRDRDRHDRRAHPDRALRPHRDRAALAGALGRAAPLRDGPRGRRRSPSTTCSRCTRIPRATCTSATGTSSRRSTRWRASGGCTATTSSSRSASTRSGCRPRTPRSRTAATRSPGRCRTSRTCGASSARWARRSPGTHEVVTADPAYYRWNQWLFLRFLEAGLAYRAMSPVDWCPNDGTLAREQVEGAGPALLALRRPGREARPGRSGSCARPPTPTSCSLRRHRLARADPHPADELDRPLRGRRDRLRDRARRRTSPAATRCASSRRDRTRCSGRPSWSWRPEHPLVPTLTHPDRRPRSTAYVEQARRRTEIDRLSTDREKTGVALGRRRDQPGQRRAHPDLHRRLRPGRLRHRRDHGRPRPRRARLRVRAEVRAADPARRRGARTSPPTPRWTTAYIAHAADERLVNSGPFDGLPADEGGKAIVARAGRDRQRGAEGHLPPARLADQPAALLGHARSRSSTARPTASSRCPTRTCRSGCPRPSTTRAAATTRSTTTRPS